MNTVKGNGLEVEYNEAIQDPKLVKCVQLTASYKEFINRKSVLDARRLQLVNRYSAMLDEQLALAQRGERMMIRDLDGECVEALEEDIKRLRNKAQRVMRKFNHLEKEEARLNKEFTEFQTEMLKEFDEMDIEWEIE